VSENPTAPAEGDSLPDDDALDALLPPRKKKRAAPVPPADQAAPARTGPARVPDRAVADKPEPAPAPAVPAPAQRAAPVPWRQAPVQAGPLDIQHPEIDGQHSTQCTVNISAEVRARFSAYQTAKRLEVGAEPTNAVIVRRALLHARKNNLFGRMLEAVRHQASPVEAEDDDPEGLFGDVIGRRPERGRVRQAAQLPFRPSYQELAVIDTLARTYGFANRSVFLNAALDEFLPPLTDKRRRS
jgi:hypothetical protein